MNRTAALFAAALVALAPWAPAQEKPSGGAVNPSAQAYFTDVVLLDQDGRPQRLYSDLMAGKVVMIHSMFADCTASCPVMVKTLRRIQDKLGDRLGTEVHLLTITVDPDNDTPAKLKEYATRIGARPGWFFLTGSHENVQAALSKLGQWVDSRDAHQTVFLIGNDATGLWKKAFALASSEEVEKVFDSVLDDHG